MGCASSHAVNPDGVIPPPAVAPHTAPADASENDLELKEQAIADIPASSTAAPSKPSVMNRRLSLAGGPAGAKGISAGDDARRRRLTISVTTGGAARLVAE